MNKARRERKKARRRESKTPAESRPQVQVNDLIIQAGLASAQGLSHDEKKD